MAAIAASGAFCRTTSAKWTKETDPKNEFVQQRVGLMFAAGIVLADAARHDQS